MANYKADTTLNERDTLMDMLFTEKTLVKLYAFASTEGCSKGFRNTIKNIYQETTLDQIAVFLSITETEYAKVCSAGEEDLRTAREKFCKIKKEL